jgi:hypothetical protein
MAEVLDWLMGDAASSGAGPASVDGSAEGDPDPPDWDPLDPSSVLCGRPSAGWNAVGVEELDRMLDSEVRWRESEFRVAIVLYLENLLNAEKAHPSQLTAWCHRSMTASLAKEACGDALPSIQLVRPCLFTDLMRRICRSTVSQSFNPH